MKAFLDIQKMKEFITSSPALYEKLKNVPQAEGK